MLARLFFLIITACAFQQTFADDQSSSEGKAALEEVTKRAEAMTPEQRKAGRQASEMVRHIFEIQSKTYEKYGASGLQKSIETCFEKMIVKSDLESKQYCFTADAVSFWMLAGEDGENTSGLTYFDFDTLIAREARGLGPEMEKATAHFIISVGLVLALLDKTEMIKGRAPTYSKRVRAFIS